MAPHRLVHRRDLMRPGCCHGGDLRADLSAADALGDGAPHVLGPLRSEYFENGGRQERDADAFGASGVGGEIGGGGQRDLRGERGQEVGLVLAVSQLRPSTCC
jgi:hypothetical protein